MITSLCILFVLLRKLACTTGVRVRNDVRQCPEDGITAWGHTDGFGATYTGMISVYMYAALQNRTYCVTPWIHTSHGTDMGAMFQWVGGSELGPPATSHTERLIHYHYHFDFVSNFPDYLNEQRQHLRDAYFGRSKDHDASLNLFGAIKRTSKHVAWHIRRGDITRLNPTRGRTNVQIGVGLTNMQRVISSNVVHFFSQGDKSDFKTIIDVCVELEIECIWHLDAPVPATHYSLSVADVLIMAHSAFSGSAGWLNQGTVYRDDQWIRTDKRQGDVTPMDLQAKQEYLSDILTNYTLQKLDPNQSLD